MSLFKKDAPSPDEQKNDAGSFAGFVLLSEAKLDKSRLYADLKNDWGIGITDDDPEQKDDVIYADIGGNRLVIGLMPTPVPDGEAEYWAKGNYMWADAETAVASHKAHAIVALLGGGDLTERGRLFVKAVCAMMKQENVIAFYNEGAVFPPKMYLDFAGMMENGNAPVLNLIWFGLYANDGKAGVYTYGMRRLGREEMEVYVDRDKADFNELREFLMMVSSYVLDTGAVLRDGETIGFSEEQKLPITLSKGIALDGDTLKIGYTK